ncbi:GNAT family N-acetyltransferase [Membranicola marinus]|uniref:GNAT family N-acetyltransferase n=1 Tax=Membranihabitans marinus TaxID=1227546 RepID=A0A953HVS5_9BACT|nr:GNAT family N-acetyltransferase [Membranihabitans marinus]MBY5957451.1 GNAT family N-acetyltransferase [Membranihabitans marinus]
MKIIDFSHAAFDQLSLRQWYAISRLRQQVFVVEQACPYLDADGRDRLAHHIIGHDHLGHMVAYARIVHPSDQVVPMDKIQYFTSSEIKTLRSRVASNRSQFNIPALGRVVLHPSVRGKGQGEVLMTYALSCFTTLFPDKPAFVSAQQPLHDFYFRHGFRQSGPSYLEDQIPHIPMVMK